jgi:hypothetical protein
MIDLMGDSFFGEQRNQKVNQASLVAGDRWHC